MIRIAVAIAAVLVGSATLAAAAPPPRSATTGASAFLLRITIPGQDSVVLGDLEWPTSTTADVQSFQYPADGSIVSIGRSRASVFASPGCGRRNAVLCRGDRRLALQRRDRGREDHGVRVRRCERPFGRGRDEGIRGAGTARARPRPLRASPGAHRSTIGARSPCSRRTAEAVRRDRRAHRRR